MKKRITIIIYGLVQGVFFRVEAKEKAKLLGLVGWSGNEDGLSPRMRAIQPW